MAGERPGWRRPTSACAVCGSVRRMRSSSAGKPGAGASGGGVRKSGMYPSGGTSAKSSARSPPNVARRGRTAVTHGRWMACRAGSLSVRRLAMSSHIGEYANRMRATSSGPSSQVTVIRLSLR
jgi:hypothetical protein